MGRCDCRWAGNDVPDAQDISDGTSDDCPPNGIPDECELEDGAAVDENVNAILDECEPDCDGDGIPDMLEFARGTQHAARSTQHDCNANGIPDACDPEDCELVIREVMNFTNWW